MFQGSQTVPSMESLVNDTSIESSDTLVSLIVQKSGEKTTWDV